MKRITFNVEKTDTGYSAFAEIPNEGMILTVGDNLAELKANMLDAYNLHLEELGAPQVDESVIAFKFDLPQFFEYYKPVINIRGLAKRIGVNESLISQYVSGTKTPSERQTQKILAGIHSLAKELLDFA